MADKYIKIIKNNHGFLFLSLKSIVIILNDINVIRYRLSPHNSNTTVWPFLVIHHMESSFSEPISLWNGDSRSFKLW